MRWEFATAARVLFGPGVRREIGPLAREFGRRALVVTGARPDRAAELLALLRAAGLEADVFPVSGEPTVATAETGVARARERACELVIACGGGSALDAGKAIAALLTNPGPVTDYLEVVGRGQPLGAPPVPFIAIPTTAGTGAEVTRNAVLAVPERRVKVSLRSPLMLPRLALVDPELTLALPPNVTAATGLDALTQLIEPYVSCRANPMTDALCAAGIPLVARALPRAFANGHDLAARTDMAQASLWSGMALANAGLGAVHGLAGPIGGRFTAPHGAVCAALLPHVFAVNWRAVRERGANPPLSARFAAIARWLTGQESAEPEDAGRWLGERVREFGIPPLRHYGIAEGDFDELITQSAAASSMKGNPVPLTPGEVRGILRAAW
ncbi:MAG: iron-containing alcohol dehydrogenase [Limisphaerales bacterium]